MYICEPDYCTGCMACYASCKKNAIIVSRDKKGFYIPNIDESKCMRCGKCRQVCPVLNDYTFENKFDKKVYACWSEDENIRFKSTSGGMFTELAKSTLSKTGIVFGATFDKNFKVIHRKCKNVNDINNFQGSKYVQSYIGDVFKEIESYLIEGKLVLFTGTPCQNAGLRRMLGKEYENLILVDIICHGVPSPRLFEEYLVYIKSKYSQQIKDIKFRYKKPSWTCFSMKIDFFNNKSYTKSSIRDPYLIGFLNDYFSKSCCHNCKFTNLNRQGDITIADFWGYVSSEFKYRNDEKGISLVLVNSQKGDTFFKDIKDNLIIRDKKIEEAIVGNDSLVKPYKGNNEYNRFWDDYSKCANFENMIPRYLYNRKYKVKSIISRFINDHSYLMTRKLRIKYEALKAKIR